MSKYLEILEINNKENFATIWHNIQERQFKVVYELETFNDKVEIAEGGYVTETHFVDVPMVTIIDVLDFDEENDIYKLSSDLNWVSNQYMHQDKIDFVAELEDELYNIINKF